MIAMFSFAAQLSPVKFPIMRDDRGALISFEPDKVIPFKVARVFWVFDVPASTLRGGHAHKECYQFLVCASGAISVEITDGRDNRTHVLEAGMSLYLPPAIFSSQRFIRPGSVLTVYCDRPYDKSDYIHDIAALKAFRSG